MEEFRYNFVFFFARYDFWRSVLGEELYNNKHVRIYKEAFSGSSLLEKIFHYHWAYSINRKICLPFKRLWFKKMFSQDFEDDLPIIFIYFAGGTIYYGKEFLQYVKRKNPNNKNVMLYADLLSKSGEKEHYLLKDLVDLELTYDASEAKKYGIAYSPCVVYSKLIPEPENPNVKYDVYFLGAAKDRLYKIHDVYRYLKKNGLRCKFIVTGVPKEMQIEGIEYSNGISYEQNLQYVIQSKCLLEIIQGYSSDITMRAREAIAYRRKFITNCPRKLTDLFHEDQLCQFEDAKDISLSFLKADFYPDNFNPKIDLNPLSRLFFIQDKVDEKNEIKSDSFCDYSGL